MFLAGTPSGLLNLKDAQRGSGLATQRTIGPAVAWVLYQYQSSQSLTDMVTDELDQDNGRIETFFLQ